MGGGNMTLDEAKTQLESLGFKVERNHDSVKGTLQAGECKVTAEWYERYQQWGASVSWRHGIEGNYQQGTGATLSAAVSEVWSSSGKTMDLARVRYEAQTEALRLVFGVRS